MAPGRRWPAGRGEGRHRAREGGVRAVALHGGKPVTAADLLPHRYPMLLVDKVLDLVDGQEVTAVKAISVNEPWYAWAGSGGFAYPQLLLVESFAQTAGILGTTVGLGDTSDTGLVTLIGSVS